MEAYPYDYLAHNYPLIVLSGLLPPQSSHKVDASILRHEEAQITSDSPLVTSDPARHLRDCFLREAGGDDVAKRKLAVAEVGHIPFVAKVVGRVCESHP